MSQRTCGIVNYYFIGDDAFGLKPNLMKGFNVPEGEPGKEFYDYTDHRFSRYVIKYSNIKVILR